MKATQRLRDVVDSLGEIVARRQAITLLAHPDLELIDQRLRPLLADGNPVVGRLAVDAPLDLSNNSSIRRTASAAIGDFDNVARSNKCLRPWLQHAASMIGAGRRLAS